KREALIILFGATVAIVLPSAGLAHHSISAEFNAAQRVTLAGLITRVTWTNPHTFFYVDATDPKTGSVVNWACELGSPNMLQTLGWTQSTLKVGMMVTLIGVPARDRTHKVIARNIVADGTALVAWPSEQPR